MSDQLKSVGFAVGVALVCSLLLTGAATGLKERKLRNVAVDRQKNILKSVGLIAPGATPDAATIERRYQDNIRCYRLDENGTITDADGSSGGRPICLYVAENKVAAYILPVDSRGLWGRIYGYIAVENDGMTVAGFSVYGHNETPGLGGEIEKPWFQQNFVGKKIVDGAGNFAGVSIAKGKVADVIAAGRKANYVDGISGATLTGKYLSGGLRQILEDYEDLSRQFRAGDVRLPAGG